MKVEALYPIFVSAGIEAALPLRPKSYRVITCRFRLATGATVGVRQILIGYRRAGTTEIYRRILNLQDPSTVDWYSGALNIENGTGQETDGFADVQFPLPQQISIDDVAQFYIQIYNGQSDDVLSEVVVCTEEEKQNE